MISLEKIGIIILILIAFFFLIRFLKELFSKSKRNFRKSTKQMKVFLLSTTKAKADRKYKKLLAEFKRKNKRKPSRNDIFRIAIAASHHTFPVKGRNVRRWTKGKTGHLNRQKVRKYLLEKHNIVEDFKMK